MSGFSIRSSTTLLRLTSHTSGTFGSVRMGLHRLTNSRVAIKQISRSSAPGSLTREIHHHRQLHHPHVCQLLEIVATESSIYLVSELCAGGELYDYLVECGRLAEHEARRIIGQLLLALGYCHAQGVCHRDLKLENVLLNEACDVKLADFGFGREFDKQRLLETFCGTTGYAAPEMLAGHRYRAQGESGTSPAYATRSRADFVGSQRSTSGAWGLSFTLCLRAACPLTTMMRLS